MRRVLALAPFDLVYADHLSMMEYARALGLPILHDAHNVEFEILRRYARARRPAPVSALLALEWRLVRGYERKAYDDADIVCAVSGEDAAAIRTLAPRARVHVVPISIDASAVVPLAAVAREPRLLFVGGLHWPPNLDAIAYFLRDIWPRVLQARPDARLTVVGRDDVAAAAALRRVPGVTLSGYVDDVAPYFAASRALVVPLRAGSGMRVKILDACARGLPVVSTPTGHEGIDVEPGVHLLSAAEPGPFAAETVRVLSDDGLAERLARAGRRLVEERYDVAAVRRALLEAVRAARARPYDL
jgi:glycosyltransferase involved in cell wall biosynthesis